MLLSTNVLNFSKVLEMCNPVDGLSEVGGFFWKHEDMVAIVPHLGILCIVLLDVT